MQSAHFFLIPSYYSFCELCDVWRMCLVLLCTRIMELSVPITLKNAPCYSKFFIPLISFLTLVNDVRFWTRTLWKLFTIWQTNCLKTIPLTVARVQSSSWHFGHSWQRFFTQEIEKNDIPSRGQQSERPWNVIVNVSYQKAIQFFFRNRANFYSRFLCYQSVFDPVPLSILSLFSCAFTFSSNLICWRP